MSRAHQIEPEHFQGVDCTGVINQVALLALLKKHPLAEILQTSRVLKEDENKRVAIISIDDTLEVFVKIYFDNNFLDRLRSFSFKSRGRRSYDKALALIEHGLPTPGSLGYVSFHSIPGHTRPGSAHFTTFLERGETLTELLKNAPEQHQHLLELGFHLLASLHSHGFIHGDLKLNNLMMQDQKLYCIDIDSAAQTTKLRARSKDLARFLVALSEANVSLEHTQKGFSEYCQMLGFSELKISPGIRRIARRIQRKHLLKYQRPARRIL